MSHQAASLHYEAALHIQWNRPTCIVCLKDGELTIEHVIPASLGGKLTSRILCKDCNNRFGHGFESDARLAPELRRAAAGMATDLGELAEALEIGARYVAHFEEQQVLQKVRSDGQFGTAKLADESLIVPEAEATNRISSILGKRGASEQEVNAAIEKWAGAEAGLILDLGRNVIVRKWANHPATPAYTEPVMSRLVPLKTAFEFAVILGVANLKLSPALERIREALQQQDEAFAKAVVTERRAPKPAPFHGIAFTGNNPAAVLKVRLFGLLAYEVTLPATALSFGSLVYTHRLDTGEDWTYQPNADSDGIGS